MSRTLTDSQNCANHLPVISDVVFPRVEEMKLLTAEIFSTRTFFRYELHENAYYAPCQCILCRLRYSREEYYFKERRKYTNVMNFQDFFNIDSTLF